MKNVLIIGGNGFIGQNLSKTLLKYQYNVFSFDIQLPKLKLEKVNYLVGDFFDDEILEREKPLENSGPNPEVDDDKMPSVDLSSGTVTR